jgi:predicted Zn-dependent protease
MVRAVVIAAFFVAACSVGALPAFGQVSTEEATAKLEKKQAAHNAEKSQLVTITKAELDELRNELARCKAELASLKRGAGAVTPAAQTAPGTKVQRPSNATSVPEKPHDMPAVPETKSSIPQDVLQLSRSTKATERQSAIRTLEKLRTQHPDDEVISTLATALKADKNSVRAAMILVEYLKKNPGKENLQNLLGSVLSEVDETKLQNSKGIDLRSSADLDRKSFYMKYDAELAKGNVNGQRRWGSNWVSAPEAESKWQAARAAESELSKAKQVVQSVTAHLQITTQERQDAAAGLHRVGITPDVKRAIEEQVKRFDVEIEKTNKVLAADSARLNKAYAEFGESRPPFDPIAPRQ